MAEERPNFALDLSNDGIALWHRSGDTGWSSLAKISLDDPEFDDKLAAMRAKAVAKGHPLRAVVRVPKSEVLMARVKLGVFKGEAAAIHTRKQIDALTPYALQDVTFDMGDKTVGNMAPVAVTSRKTLTEARDFALQQGFQPVYFTTQYTNREFPREPRFYLDAPRKPLLPLLSKIAAAAAIGLTAGYFGYTHYLGPQPEPEAISATPVVSVEQAQPAKPAKTAMVTAPPAVTAPPPPKESNQPPRFDAVEMATLLPPETTAYPEILLDPLQTFSFARLNRLVRPRAGKYHSAPTAEFQSGEIKTDALTLFEAWRDLPAVAMTADDVTALETGVALAALVETPPQVGFTLAFQTSKDAPFPAMEYARPADPASPGVSLSATSTNLPDPPPPPPSYLSAEPGSLTPTPEGTRGPENILIFSGRPQLASKPRPVVAPPPDPMAGFRPKARPATLLSAAQLAALEAEAIAASASSIEPKAATEVATLTQTPTSDQPGTPGETSAPDLASTPTDAGTNVGQPAALGAPSDAETTPQTPAETELAPATPATAPVAAETTEQPTPQTATAPTPETTKPPADPDALLALADPSLKDFKPRGRPADLNVPVVLGPEGLIADADPALSGFRPKERPANLKVPASAIVTPSVPTLESATSLAVATSLLPKIRPAKIAAIAARLALPSDTAVTAITPDDAIGTSHASDGPTTVTVAKAATVKSKFNKSRMNLVGVFGTPKDRRALVRLSSGRYVKVKKGDRLSGWKVSAIGETTVRIHKGTKDKVLRLP